MVTMTKEELLIMDKKALNPQNEVLCPRCGKPLEYFDYGSSYIVKCPTDGCLKETMRGI